MESTGTSNSPQPEITVFTGSGDADCGVGPLTGLVGITASTESGRPTMNICGSLHQPGAVGLVLSPIPLVGVSPEPPLGPAVNDGNVLGWVAVFGGGVS